MSLLREFFPVVEMFRKGTVLVRKTQMRSEGDFEMGDSIEISSEPRRDEDGMEEVVVTTESGEQVLTTTSYINMNYREIR